MDKFAALKPILDCGVIAIIRAASPHGLVEAAEAIVAGGVAAVEFTLTTPDALRLIGAARQRLGERALVGVGTVLSAEDAQAALDVGAQFVVTPALQRDVVETTLKAGVPVVPGAYTPTEIVAAFEWSADLVKLFPASAGGPSYVRAILDPLPHVRLVPTGGVNAANAGDYIRAGAVAVAAGGSLADPVAIAAGEFGRLTDAARQLIVTVQRGRGEQLP